MRINQFVKRFKSYEELEEWLTRQSKDYLYSLYMEDTNYDGISYRRITRRQLKDIFLDKYIIEELERDEYLWYTFK